MPVCFHIIATFNSKHLTMTNVQRESASVQNSERRHMQDSKVTSYMLI